MPNQSLPVLTDQQALVLFAVWTEKQSNRSKGMTNIEIRQAVHADVSRESEHGTSLPNIKKIIRQLLEWPPTPLLLAFRAGKERKIYQLPKDTMVTWVPSARLVLSLESDPRGTVERSAFIQRMLRLNMKNPDTGEPLTPEEIDIQIDYCREMHFPYIEEDNKGLIKTTGRVHRERAFLEKIEKSQRSLDLDVSA